MSGLQRPAIDDAASATNRHYERRPEAFAAFLDARMKYTCALFASKNQTLEEAQDDYLLYIAKRLCLTGGERVLDVGCGWGSLTLFLAQELGCHVVGVTPAAVQAEFIRERACRTGVQHLVEIEVSPFQTVGLAGRFDAAAMVEVIEHLPEHREPLKKVFKLLELGGHLFMSAFCYRSRADRREYEQRPASMHALDLFGFTAMVPLSQLVAEVEDVGFSLATLADTTSDYDQTMEHWQFRIENSRELMDSAQPGFADELQRYFDTARASWGHTSKHYALTAVRSRMGDVTVE